MARHKRLSVSGGIHHVLNRCNHRVHLLSETDLQDCCALLMETKRRWGLQIFGYAFLHNHYHLILREPAEGTLTRAMHWFNGSAASRYNLRNNITGHLWQGRFKSRLLENEDRDFLQCLLYVDLNPARAGLAPQLTDWKFSSTRAHADDIPDPLLDPTPIPLTNYRQMLQDDLIRTRQLQRDLTDQNRAAVKAWLQQANHWSLTPYAREISHLVGRNFRQHIPKEPRVLSK